MNAFNRITMQSSALRSCCYSTTATTSTAAVAVAPGGATRSLRLLMLDQRRPTSRQLQRFASGTSRRLPRQPIPKRQRRASFPFKGGRRGGKKESKPVAETETPVLDSVAAAAETTANANATSLGFQQRLVSWIVPVRYRNGGAEYTREQGIAIAQRLPLWLLLVGLASWERTAPVSIVSIKGPSMLPTMAPDASDIWFLSTWCGWRKVIFRRPYKIGDVIGFAHPDHPEHVSCKRIIGLAGDKVQRYGQYVHLYLDQDPERWGIIWPAQDHPAHEWMDRESFWDADQFFPDRLEESKRTLVVPEGCIWVEADCPALGIDSRHIGPVPFEWIQGKVLGRIWPFWQMENDTNTISSRIRPHPIPLDTETLAGYNVHRIIEQ